MAAEPEDLHNKKEKPKRTTECPRCGQSYPEREWTGDCSVCGYPDIYYDTPFKYGI